MGKEAKKVLYWKEQIETKQRLERRLENLHIQWKGICSRENELQVQYEKEQSDVEKLQQKNTANFIRKVMRKQKELLEEKEREVLFTQEKQERLQKEKQEMQQEIQDIETALQEMADCENQYYTAIQSAIACIPNKVEKQRLQEMADKQKQLIQQLQEKQACMCLLSRAIHTTQDVCKEIQQAKDYGRSDITNMVMVAPEFLKHKHLDKGAKLAEDMLDVLKRVEQTYQNVTFAKNLSIKLNTKEKIRDYVGLIWHDLELYDDMTETEQKLQKIIWQLEYLYQEEKQKKEAIQTEQQNIEAIWLVCL